MNLLKLLLLTIATTIMISGCSTGGGSTKTDPQPTPTDLGYIVPDTVTKTITYTPSAQVGSLSQGNVYCTITKNGVLVGDVIQFSPVTDTNKWLLDYSGNSISAYTWNVYSQIANGTYSGEYLVSVWVRVNGIAYNVSSNYSISLDFSKSSGDGNPPPPPW